MAAVPQFTRQEDKEHQSVEYFTLKQSFSCVEDDIKPLALKSGVNIMRCRLSAFSLSYEWRLWTSCEACTVECVKTMWSVPVVVKILTLTLCSTRLLRILAPSFPWSSTNHGSWKLGNLAFHSAGIRTSLRPWPIPWSQPNLWRSQWCRSGVDNTSDILSSLPSHS